jgi:hypothetical protein
VSKIKQSAVSGMGRKDGKASITAPALCTHLPTPSPMIVITTSAPHDHDIGGPDKPGI